RGGAHRRQGAPPAAPHRLRHRAGRRVRGQRGRGRAPARRTCSQGRGARADEGLRPRHRRLRGRVADDGRLQPDRPRRGRRRRQPDRSDLLRRRHRRPHPGRLARARRSKHRRIGRHVSARAKPQGLALEIKLFAPRRPGPGRHPRRVRDDPGQRRQPPAYVAPPHADAARHRRPGSDRNGRRQRRRRRLHLRPGRAGLRLLAAMDAAPPDPRPDRQPGDGGTPRRGHRRRLREADPGALRPLLGLVLRGRDLPPELPDHQHRVHGRQPRRRVLRPPARDRRPRRGRAPGRITVSGNFRRWERAMFVFLFASLLVLPLAVLSHPDPGAALKGFLVPGVQGGLTSNSALLIVAVVGTTVAPWQLFFQQSNVIDKRITPRWLDYDKADTAIGAFVVVIGAAAIMMATASAFTGTSEFGHYQDGLRIARGLASHISPVAGTIFALLLFDASIVGASAVTLATSYAFGDMFGVRHSLHRGVREAKLFYASYTGLVALAAAIALISPAPLRLITTAVQALAGITLPSATVFAVLLCNDRAVLGPWVNKLWLNAVAGVIVAAMLVLSLILVVSTVVPS